MTEQEHGIAPVHMPSPTPWPMVMSLGITLIPGGLILGPRLGEEGTLLGWVPAVTILGIFLFFLALFRMIRQDINEAAHAGHDGPGHG